MKAKKGKAHFVLLIIVGILVIIVSTLLIKGQRDRRGETFVALTEAQKEEDFQYLCDTLDEIYPFWYEVEQNGLNRDEIYADYSDRILKTATDERFYERLDRFTSEFNNLGHLSVLSGRLYSLHKKTFQENPDVARPWIQVLENDTTKVFYAGLINYESISTGASNQPEANAESMLETRIIDDQTAYLKIPNFLSQSIQIDQSAIFSFYNEIRNMDNLIIDIRANSGGSDNYWRELLVEPITKQDISQSSYALFQKNDLVLPFLEADFSSEEIKPILELPNFSNPTYDYETVFSNFVVRETTFTSAESPFQGRIWLLVDDKVYSSSENFAIFCKDTGFATLVGQPTGGDGGLASNPFLFSLPNSGVVCRFSYLYRLNSDGSSNEMMGTTPDITVEDEQDSLAVCLAEIQKNHS